MGEQIQTKPSKEDKTKQVAEHSSKKPSPAGPYADFLAFQDAAGNHAVSPLLDSNIDDRIPSTNVVPPIVHSILSRSGQPLDLETRAFMESHFGHDFGHVRVHTDAEADLLNHALSARAFTSGRDIFFRRGAYAPGTSGGRELLAHELTHVVQQTGGIRPKQTIRRSDDRYEQEAARMARTVVRQNHEATRVISSRELMRGTVSSNLSLNRAIAKSSDHHQPLSIQPQLDDERNLVSFPPTRELSSTERQEPRAVYLIRESVHRVPGLPSIPYTRRLLGPSLIKVQRVVVQLHATWEPAGGQVSMWDALLDWLGVDQIQRNYTGEHRWVIAYNGFRNIIQARGGVELIEAPTLGVFELGNDPIPHIQLYGNSEITFSSSGGQGAPTASALYDGSNNQLEVISNDEAPDILDRALALPGSEREPGPVVSE